MKITIEPTEKQSPYPIQMQNPKIEIWIAGDNHSLSEVINFLVIPALNAFGYVVTQEMITIDLLA